MSDSNLTADSRGNAPTERPASKPEIMKLTVPNALLRLEGLAALGASLFAYAVQEFSWTLFLFLFLAPDLTMVGYLWGARVGACIYNAGHTYCAPAMVWMVARFGHHPSLLPLALIWAAHIGFDRFWGYGLKYRTGFKDTHLGRA